MRGRQEPQVTMLAFVDLEERVPADHPLRTIKALADEALTRLSPEFERMYADVGRPSIPPERLLKASLLIALYSVRSERAFCEELDYNLLFRWFLGMQLMERSFDPTVFTKNRQRLLEHQVGQQLFDEVVLAADPEARLFRKGKGKEAKLVFMAHALMENRNGLLVDFLVSDATGTAERDAVPVLLDEARERGFHPQTLGADKGYDMRGCVGAMRARGVAPHVAQHTSGRSSAIDGRTTRHRGYALSQRLRKRVEEIFGWMKTVGGFRRTRYRGLDRTGLAGYLVGTAYNLVRMARLMTAETPAHRPRRPHNQGLGGRSSRHRPRGRGPPQAVTPPDNALFGNSAVPPAALPSPRNPVLPQPAGGPRPGHRPRGVARHPRSRGGPWSPGGSSYPCSGP